MSSSRRSSVASTSSGWWPAAKLKLSDPSSGSTVIVGVMRRPRKSRAPKSRARVSGPAMSS